jgi:hypothetical protein
VSKYLISFPGAAIVVPGGEWEAVSRDAHAVIEEAVAWAARIAKACRCGQELRVFWFDPRS